MVALTVAVLILVILPMVRRPRRQLAGVIPLSLAACLILLFAFFYKPVLILTGLGEFEYGANSLWDSWTGFIRDSLYGRNWIGESTMEVVSVFGALLIAGCFGLVWLPVREKENAVHAKYGRILAIIGISLIAFFVLSHEFLDAFYPVGRKSVIYFTPFALLVYFVFVRFVSRIHIPGQILQGVAGTALILHFALTFNSRVFREWWYDSSTKEVVLRIASKSVNSDPVPFAVEWIFHPTSNFYISTRSLPVKLAHYSKEISSAFEASYYYLHPDKAGEIASDFEHEQTFEGRWLMKRKE
jgi:hypothetical protein